MTGPSPDPTRNPVDVDVDELLVARAARRVYGLVDPLITTPIHPEVYAEVRRYLDTEAGQAVAAYQALLRRPADQLARRVSELLRRPATTDREAQ
jgi:hypothetical protein